MGRAIGPVARIRTRALYRVIEERWSRSGLVMLSDEAHEELQFWHQNMHSLNAIIGQPIFKKKNFILFFLIYFFTGDILTWFFLMPVLLVMVASYVVDHELDREVAHGQWSLVESSKQSSTWRELKSVDQVLRSFSVKFSRP